MRFRWLLSGIVVIGMVAVHRTSLCQEEARRPKTSERDIIRSLQDPSPPLSPPQISIPAVTDADADDVVRPALPLRER